MCWKLDDDISGEMVCRSTIHSAIKPGTANLQVDTLESIPDVPSPTGTLLDDFMSLADFDTPLLYTKQLNPVDSIPTSTKSQAW